MNSNLFRTQSSQAAHSPEQLDDYIQVTAPNFWAITLASAILVVAFLVWSVFGTLITEFSFHVVVKDQVAYAYIDDTKIEGIDVGTCVDIGDKHYPVTSVLNMPVSSGEIEKQYDAYTFYKMDIPNWSYVVTIEAPEMEDGIYAASITTSAIHPISFMTPPPDK